MKLGYLDESVGPVLHATPLGWAIVTAIEATNDGVHVSDEGAYLRVFASGFCRVTRADIEAEWGQPLQLPGDLELVMSAFSGLVALNEDGAVWWRSSEPRPELPS
jgi:toluene monooxygenase system protein D